MALSESKKINHLITFFISGIVILFIFAIWLRFASAEGGYDYITKWGSTGTSEGKFYYPGGIAVDNNFNNVYVVDSENNRIQKFDTNGIFATKWGSYGTGNTQFFYPIDVAVDSNSNVYVTDSENMYVKKYNSNGDFVLKWKGVGYTAYKDYYPSGIAIDGNDNIFVVYLIDDWNAETLKYGVQKYNTTGGLQKQKITIESKLNGYFNYPQGIEVDSGGNVYVVDSDNNRIQKFDNNLQYLGKWGSAGTLNGQFRWPTDVSVDSDGNVYVVDTGNNRIQKFDSSGKFITKWGVFGTAIGRFNFPYGIAIDNDGNVYVVDTGNNRIQKFAMKPMTINTGNQFTNSPVVSLKFNTVSFNVTNAVNVKVKNSTSALETTPTEAFSTTKSWTLAFDTGDGVKTVYAQLEDDVSTILDIISDTIILDRKQPMVAYYDIYRSPVKRGTYTKLRYNITDNLSPQVYVTVKVINPKGITVLNKSLGTKAKSTLHYYSYKTPSTPTGYYKYIVIARDYAGNVRTTSTKKFKVY